MLDSMLLRLLIWSAIADGRGDRTLSWVSLKPSRPIRSRRRLTWVLVLTVSFVLCLNIFLVPFSLFFRHFSTALVDLLAMSHWMDTDLIFLS